VEGQQVTRTNGSRRGITLIEIMVASFILLLFLSAVFTAVMSLQRQYEIEIVRRTAFLRMQSCLDMMTTDMRESGVGLIYVANFNDVAFSTPAQTVVVMASARNTTDGKFVSLNASAVWQKVIIYAPYWNAALNEGEIRRYVASGVPAGYFAMGTAVNITVNATNILLDGFVVARDGTPVPQEHLVGFMKVLEKVDQMTMTANINPATVSASIRCKGNLIKSINMDMNTGSRGRN
jgi:hypothetical protein